MSLNVVETNSLSKRYGATIALSEASLTIKKGEVHALLGENGAGKSTLVKVLSGIVSPNSGSMKLDDKHYSPNSIVDSRHSGVATAFQELSLIPHLTVAENLLLPKASQRSFFPDPLSKIIKRASVILNEWEITDISPSAIVEDLSLAQRQRLEITRALSHAKRLLILDEPTAALPNIDWLFKQIGRITKQGVAVMYISHRLAEVRDISERATVMRNGSSIKTVELKGVSDEEIFAMMVGHKPETQSNQPAFKVDSAKEVLLMKGLSVGDVSDLNLSIKAGEIVGLGALEGQGQHSLFNALGGISMPRSGEVFVNDEKVKFGSPSNMLNCGSGVVFIPEERKTDGIFPNLSAATNIVLSSLAGSKISWFVNRKVEKRYASTVSKKVAIADRYLDFIVGALSGGNQQKVLLARALMTGARCLVLFDPARGVDVGTKQAIYAMMREFVSDGGAILFYSSELSELVHLSSRCIVMYGGKIVSDLDRDELSEEKIISHAHGHLQDDNSNERLAG